MSIRQTATVIAVISAAAAAIMLGWKFSPGTTSQPEHPDADPQQRHALLENLAADPTIDPALLSLVEGLQNDLQVQQQAIARLAEQLAEIERADAEADDPQQPADATDTESELFRQFRNRRGPVSEERLVTVGFSVDQAREIVGRADTIAMERLNTQYQAAREGWLDTDQYREALDALPDIRETISAEYGDDAYDRYLYASGRPNRLVVRDVLQDSPAGAAGLQTGDQVLAMADQRIYSTRDLMSVASSGSEGETVPLVVQRGDVTFEIYVPRGPLGIRGGRGFEAPKTP
jgi:C-terminal processing protease CtpA/Prc